MNVVFGNAHWLGFLALASVPILLHLVARARPPRYEFASLKFIREATKKTMRLRQPRDWLVLALRTLAILALVLAFLHPRLLRQSAQASAGAERTVVLLVDRSASMGYAPSGSSRMAKAADQAKAILDSFRGPTLANVVWKDRSPEAVFPEPGPNRGFLLEEIQKQQAVPEPGAVEVAWRLALTQFEKRPGTVAELFVLSDFQASSWRDARLETPDQVRVQTVPLAENAVENLAIVQLTPTPRDALIEQPFELRCRVANYSDKPRRSRVFFRAGEQRQTRTIDLAPWGEAEASVAFRSPGRPGLMALEARLEEDAFPGDDERFGLVAVREAVKLAVVAPTPEPPSMQTVTQLDAAFAWISVEAASTIEEALNANPDMLLVIDGSTAPEQMELLAPYVEAGGTVWSALGASAGEEQRAGGWTSALVAESDPVVALFKDGAFGDPFAAVTEKRYRFPDGDAGTTLAQFQDGLPAVRVHRNEGGGAHYVSVLPLDSALSSWSAQGSFVALWGEILRESLQGRRVQNRETLTGMPHRWEPPGEVDATAVRLLDAAQVMQPVQAETARSGPVLASVGSARPGIYRWTLSGTTVDQQFANFPPLESDLRVLEKEALPGQALTGEANETAALLSSEGQPIWPWCLGIAIACLFGEALVLGWRGRIDANLASSAS